MLAQAVPPNVRMVRPTKALTIELHVGENTQVWTTSAQCKQRNDKTMIADTCSKISKKWGLNGFEWVLQYCFLTALVELVRIFILMVCLLPRFQ